MIDSTAVVIGPGGVGKGPLDALFRSVVQRLDPYRLRLKGPKRDRDDPFYGHPRLRHELQLVFAVNGDKNRRVGPGVEWFPKSSALFFRVREEWQLLLLLPLRFSDGLAKLEIFAPVLLTLISDVDVAGLFGDLQIILLNPTPTSMSAATDLQQLKKKTRTNCEERGDSESDVETRVCSVTEEAPAWRALLSSGHVTELLDWPFPEYKFQEAGSLEAQRAMLRDARKLIVEQNAKVEIVLKSDDEIERIVEPIVKLA